MYRSALVAACAAGLVALTACAAGPGTGAGGTPEATGTPGSAASAGATDPNDPGPNDPGSSSPRPGLPTISSYPPVTPELPQPDPTAPRGAEVTVVGTVIVSEIEIGCLMLEGYELYGGDRALIQPRRRVRVTGVIATDLMSICQQGPILRVISAEPA